MERNLRKQKAVKRLKDRHVFFDFELDSIQTLHNNEDYLRKRCGLSAVGLSWVDMCNIFDPIKSLEFKKNFLNYLSKKDTQPPTETMINKLSCFKDYIFYINGINNILDEQFKDIKDEFVDTMLYMIEIDGFKNSIDEAFRLTYLYFIHNKVGDLV